MGLVHRYISKGAHNNETFLDTEEHFINAESGVEASPHGVLFTKADEDLTRAYGCCEFYPLHGLSLRILDIS